MNKFSAGIFCFFMGIQASFAGLFDAKKKSPSAAASRGKTVVYDKINQLYVTDIDLYKINYPSNDNILVFLLK